MKKAASEKVTSAKEAVAVTTEAIVDIKNIDIKYKAAALPNEKLINLTDAANIRFTNFNGVNFLQNKSDKNILRISPYYSTINILDFQRNSINIGDKPNQNAVDVNIKSGSLNLDEGDITIVRGSLNIREGSIDLKNGVMQIDGTQVVGAQLDDIPDNLPLEKKVFLIVKILRAHGLIKDSSTSKV